MTMFACTPVSRGIRIPEIYLVSIAHAIQVAWSNLKKSSFLEYGDEDKVSSELMEELNELLSKDVVESFSYDTFETVCRDSKLKNFSGESIDEMPDFTFRLAGKWSGSKTNTGVFVECKVIDNKRGLDLYTKNGISRYVEGKYAWKMAHGMMVGYVYNSKKLPNDLDAFFKRGVARSAKKYSPIGTIQSKTNMSSPPEVYTSVHARKFTFKDGTLPGNIALDHIWLYRENVKK